MINNNSEHTFKFPEIHVRALWLMLQRLNQPTLFSPDGWSISGMLIPDFQTALVSIGILQQKKQTGGLRIYFSENPLGNFRFVTLPLEIPEKTSYHAWKFSKIVWHPLEVPRSKSKTHGNSTSAFPSTPPGNSVSFLIDPWNLHIFFLQYPWKFHVTCPQPLLFGFFLE